MDKDQRLALILTVVCIVSISSSVVAYRYMNYLLFQACNNAKYTDCSVLLR